MLGSALDKKLCLKRRWIKSYYMLGAALDKKLCLDQR